MTGLPIWLEAAILAGLGAAIVQWIKKRRNDG